MVLTRTATGVGKPVAALAVCRALVRTGQTPVAARAGLDFIYPSHYAAALDPRWLAGSGASAPTARRATDADIDR